MDFTFGELLRGFRKRASLTRPALAESVDVHVNTIGIWERGEYLPKDRQTVLRLAVELTLKPAETDQLLRAADFQPELAAEGASHYQLRPPVADFVGRSDELQRLRAALLVAEGAGSGLVLSGVHGMGGVGKTELAYRVIHNVHAAFPDGQIMIDMRGASHAPLAVEHALQHVIHTFTPDRRLPTDLSGLQHIYRSLLHDKRVLILADDARDAAQVRPLIPPADCALIVTSRQRFTLPGMTAVHLEQLHPDDAAALLRAICARLSEADAQTLAQACGYLPLALRISAGVLHNDPALSVADYLQSMADQHQRLNQLRDPDDPELDVAATLALSYDLLDAAAQRVFRQLGVLAGDFSTELAQAAVVAPAGQDTPALLRLLLRRNLVRYDTARGRWSLHDLVRSLAHSRLEAAGEREAAAWRYGRAVVELMGSIHQQYLDTGNNVLVALERFDSERAHIDEAYAWAWSHAGTAAGDQLLVGLALEMNIIENLRYDARYELLPRWEQVLDTARRLKDQRSEGRALNKLALIHAMLGDFRQAIPYLTLVLTIADASGDLRSTGMALSSLGIANTELGNAQEALSYNERAVAVARQLGDRSAEMITVNNLGNTHLKLGDAEQAIGHLEEALAIARAIGSHYHQGVMLHNLGNARLRLGDTEHAVRSCTEALALLRAIGDQREEGYTLISLARAEWLRGSHAYAAGLFAQAQALFQKVGDSAGQAECSWEFGLALARQGQREQALPLMRAALAYEEGIGHPMAATQAALLARVEAGEPLPPLQAAGAPSASGDDD